MQEMFTKMRCNLLHHVMKDQSILHRGVERLGCGCSARSATLKVFSCDRLKIPIVSNVVQSWRSRQALVQRVMAAVCMYRRLGTCQPKLVRSNSCFRASGNLVIAGNHRMGCIIGNSGSATTASSQRAKSGTRMQWSQSSEGRFGVPSVANAHSRLRSARNVAMVRNHVQLSDEAPRRIIILPRLSHRMDPSPGSRTHNTWCPAVQSHLKLLITASILQLELISGDLANAIIARSLKATLCMAPRRTRASGLNV